MDSTSRETLGMKTFEQSDSGEFVTNADSLPSTLNIRGGVGDVPSFPHQKTVVSSNNIFELQELSSSMPPSEVVVPLLLPPRSPSSKPPPPDVGLPSSGDSRTSNLLT